MINNDAEFKSALEKLTCGQQRRIGAAFVRNVLALTADPAIAKVVDVAANAHAAEDELAQALRNARAAALESHTRCGADCDWQTQAGYFVARAAAALVVPEQSSKSPAWEAAANARMARTCGLISAASTAMHQESEAQYQLLMQFLHTLAERTLP